MLGETVGGDVFASTFHSACVRILRRDAERIGFPRSFTIYDSDDQQRVIKQIYKDLMIDDKFLPVKSAVSQISSFKDKLLSARGYCSSEAPRRHQGGAHLQALHHLRQAPAEKGGRDGLRRPDLSHRPAAARPTTRPASYYQQISSSYVVWWTSIRTPAWPSSTLCACWAGGSNNVCVVGDDDQSIYQLPRRHHREYPQL